MVCWSGRRSRSRPTLANHPPVGPVNQSPDIRRHSSSFKHLGKGSGRVVDLFAEHLEAGVGEVLRTARVAEQQADFFKGLLREIKITGERLIRNE